MNLLLDTHIALWAVANNRRLSSSAKEIIADPQNAVWVSAASLWEIAVKHAIYSARKAMPVSAAEAHDKFSLAGYVVLAIGAAHALALEKLPLIHKDPFDRMLVAQAHAEGMTLLTSDATVAKYPGDVRKV